MSTSGYFATPISVYNKKFEGLKETIVSYADTQKEDVESGVAVSLKHNLKESKFDFLHKEDKVIQDLRQWILECWKLTIESVHKKDVNFDYFIPESWYHITEKDGYHETHYHANCSWCGIYYVDDGGSLESGQTKFLSPIDGMFMDDGNEFINQQSIFVSPAQAGKLILFPSYLKHSVSQFKGNGKRITIAFNGQSYEKN